MRPIHPVLLIFLGTVAWTNSATVPPKALAQDYGATLPYKYLGNRQSFKFHRPACKFGKAMAPWRLVLFRFRKEAVDSGYTPCNYCLPQVWIRVGASLLPGSPDPPEDIGNAANEMPQPLTSDTPAPGWDNLEAGWSPPPPQPLPASELP